MLEKMRIYNSNFRLMIPAVVLVVIGVSTIFVLLAMTRHIQHEMHKIAGNTHMILLQQAHDKAHHILLHINASTFSIAQIIGSLKFTNTSSFSSIQNQVFPLLFEAYTMFPLVSQISYVSTDKHMLSYYMDGNQTYALFSTSSNLFVSQKVNITNGEGYGEEIALPELQTNASKWVNDVLNGTSGYTNWGLSFGREKQQMLFFTASTPDHNGVISLGLLMENYTNHVLSSKTYNYGTKMYLSSNDGNIYEYSGVVPHSFQSTPEQINSVCHAKIKSLRWKQFFDCSSVDIGGMKMVVAAITYVKEVFSIKYVQALNIGIITLLCILILGLVAESYIMLLTCKNSMKKETCLKADLIKLKEAVQQAERKSMNKSLAFASASHDVRNSLSGITGLIELCRKEVQSSYASMQLSENLMQMQACASELLGIVNSVLDMSKVEAGKMQLEEAEFDIGHVIEESVDFCNIAALDKGLEVIWDPCDFSIMNGRASRVKGDYRRFKQILDNLLGNARKFTQCGHIVLRGWASKQNEYDINHNLIEFVFEVDDTGIGIPKEKRESIFENYVQVKESAFEGQEGTGLGLGIVQSLVRLMGGEIGVIDKVRGEKGACFRFNIFLKAADINIFESTKGLKEFTEMVKTKGGTMKSILLVSGDETRRILKHFMENIGIEANIIESWEQVDPTLVKSKRVISKRFRSNGSSNKITVSDTKIEDQTLPFDSDDISCTSKRFKDSSSMFFLILIDIDSCGGVSNVYSILNKFLKFKFENNNRLLQFKIVCLVNPNTDSAEIKRIKETSCVPLRKPIHGSKLHDIIRMIQEFGGIEEDKASYIPSKAQPKLESSDVEVNTEEQKQLNGKKILLVEDTMVMRAIAIRVLSKLGAVVEVADNGLKALNMIKNALQDSSCHCTEIGKNKHLPYDFVLMDCEMPVMNGFEATKSIREEEKKYGIHIPIFALTGHTEQDQINKATSAGMDFHLAKPIKEENILEAIRQLRQVMQY